MAQLLLIYKALTITYCDKCGMELPSEYTQIEPDTKRVHKFLTLSVRCSICGSFTDVKCKNVYNEVYAPPVPPTTENLSIWDFNEIIGTNVPDSSVNPDKFGNGTINNGAFTLWNPVYNGDTALFTFGVLPGQQYLPYIDFPQLSTGLNWIGFTMCGWLYNYSVPADDMYCMWNMAFAGKTEILVASGTNVAGDLTLRIHIGSKTLEVIIPAAELAFDFSLVFWQITVDALGNATLKARTKDTNPTHTDTDVGVPLPDNVKYYLRAWEQRPESSFAYLPGGGILGRHKIYNGALDAVDLDAIYASEYDYYYSVVPPIPDQQGLWEINEGIDVIINNTSITPPPKFNDGIIVPAGIFNWTQVNPPILPRNVLDISGGSFIDFSGTTPNFDFSLGFTITGWIATKKLAWMPDQVILSITNPMTALEIYTSMVWVNPPGEWRCSIAVFDGVLDINLPEHNLTDDFVFYAYTQGALGLSSFYVFTSTVVSYGGFAMLTPLVPLTDYDMYLGAPTPNSMLPFPLDGRAGKHTFYVGGELSYPQIEQIVLDEASNYWV